MNTKRNFQKVLSAILVLMMVLSTMVIVPMTASAADWDGSVSTTLTGAGTAESPYQIATAADLAYWATIGSNSYAVLTADITLSGHQWTPAIMSNFSLDGQGHKIIGLTIGTPEEAAAESGLFREVSGESVVLKNVTFEGAYVRTGDGQAGSILFSNNTKPAKLEVTNVHIDATSQYIGTWDNHHGLFVGRFYGAATKATFTNCSNAATGIAQVPDGAYGKIGGFVGNVQYADVEVSFKNCVNNGNLTGSRAAGFIGHIEEKKAGAVSFEYCINNGDMTAPGQYAAGFIAYMQQTPADPTSAHITNTFKYCLNTGDMSAANIVAGLVGYAVTLSSFVFENCGNEGNLSTTGSCYAGGLVGYFQRNTSFNSPTGEMQIQTVFKNVYSTGNISVPNNSGQNVGGMVGRWEMNYPANTVKDTGRINNFYAKGIEFTLPVAESYAEGVVSCASPQAGGGETDIKWADCVAYNCTVNGVAAPNRYSACTIAETDVVSEPIAAIRASITGYVLPATVTIDAAEDLTALGATFAALAEGMDTVYVNLTADIDMAGKTFTPVATNKNVIFSGNGYAIKNLAIGSADAPYEGNAALFATAGAASSFTNVKMENVAIYATGYAASLVADMAGGYDVTLSGIYTSGTVVSTGSTAAGAIANVNKGAYGTISDDWYVSYCINEATVSGLTTAGGILGTIAGSTNMNVSYCMNKGTISVTNNDSKYGNDNAGGILGIRGNPGVAAITHSTFAYCVNFGTITTCDANPAYNEVSAGGIFGDFRTSHIGVAKGKNTITVESCYDYSAHNMAKADVKCHQGLHGYHGDGEVKGFYINNSFALPNGGTTPYTALHRANGTIKPTNSALVTSYDAAITTAEGETTFGAAITALAATIQNAVYPPVPEVVNPSLTISTESANLSIRIKLTDDFGFKAITSFKLGDETMTLAAADELFTEYGFAFLQSETAVEAEAVLANGTKVAGAAYNDSTTKFEASYTDVFAADLDNDIYFVAYAADAEGNVITSEVRTINLYTVIQEGANGTICGTAVENDAEVALYSKIVAYYEAYVAYFNSVA